MATITFEKGDAPEAGDRLMHAAELMVWRLRRELYNVFAIATTSRSNGADEIVVVLTGPRRRPYPAGTAPDAPRLGTARRRFRAYFEEDETIELVTHNPRDENLALIGMETLRPISGTSTYANPFTWYVKHGARWVEAMTASSTRAWTTLGPALCLLHELDHTSLNCMLPQPGGCTSIPLSSETFNLSIDPETNTVQDVDAVMAGHPDVVPRGWYPGGNRPGGRPGGTYNLGTENPPPGSRHEWVRWPTRQELLTGRR